MKQLHKLLRPALAAVVSFAGICAGAQGPAQRLAAPIQGRGEVALPGSRPPMAANGVDLGTVPSGTKVAGVTLVFNRSPAQESALQTLLTALQTPGSPQYHQWLNPDTFAAQFGLASSDLASVQSWLQTQGFTVDSVSRSHDRINFTGTAGQIDATFGTQLHQYNVGGETHFAPNSDLSLPAALAPIVSAVLHVSDFRPKPQVKLAPAARANPAYTSSQTQEHFLTPKDLATMYNISPVYSQGYTGVGQAIAIAGQSTVQNTDITNFQTAAGLPSNLPTQVLVPNTGPASVSYGDEGESDIDLEYSSGVATGAQIFFVIVGNNENYDAFDAFAYAVTEDIAPVVSVSYGNCELALGSSYILSENAVYEEAAAQGQTLIASSGDSGASACFGNTTTGTGAPISTAQQEAPAINFPADSPYVTALGGLQMASGDSSSSQYWASASGSDVISSLLSYVPETVWNEDFVFVGSPNLSSGGGGASIYITRPTWQTGVPGIPAGTTRLIPDISLQASTSTPGYVYCSSDPTDLAQEDLSSSCSNGFRDSTNTYLTVAGGTSFSAPIFAGMMAVLNQATHAVGQGNANATFYGLASNATTYASAFHDITSGSNACGLGSAYCSSLTADFDAGVGYDEASGIGSVNLANLIAAWPASSSSTLTPTQTTLSASSTAPASGASDTVTITVAPIANSGIPTGTVQIFVDSSTAGTATATLTLNNGQATYTYPGTTVTGSHVVVAVYSGDATYASSRGSLSLTTPVSGAPTGSFTLAATAASLTNNSTIGSSNITVTSVNGYVGEVNLLITSGLPANVCYTINPLYVDPTYGPSTGTVSIVAGTSVCGAANSRPGTGGAQVSAGAKRAANTPAPAAPLQKKPVIAMFAGLLAMGFASSRRKLRRLPSLMIVALVTLAMGLGLSGCGGSNGGNVTPPTTGSGTGSGSSSGTNYTLTLVGTDSVNPSITTSTTFTLTIAP